MEEMKMMSSCQDKKSNDLRKPYEAPSAEVILLAPQETLAAWDTAFIPEGDRWIFGQWGYKNKFGGASGMEGVVEAWDLPKQ